MYNSADIAHILFCLLISQLFMVLPSVQRLLSNFAPTRGSRFIIALLIGFSAHYAGSKAIAPTGNAVAQFVTALVSGGLIDESGLVAASSQAETVAAFADLAYTISDAASQTVVNAQGDIADVAYLITNTERRVVYLASDLPRADPNQHTNSNIAATIERMRQSEDGSELSLYCWFSQEPTAAPGMCAEIDVGAGFFELDPVTNYYPATTLINGIPCVEYIYAIPSGSRHVTLRPEYEITFGAEETPLLVPSGGITVDAGEQTYLPFTGVDTYYTGRVAVVYHGGIATELRIDGVTVTNGVYSL